MGTSSFSARVIPQTHWSCANFSRATGIAFSEGLIKNRYVHRTFIQPEQGMREQGIRVKFNPLADWRWADVWHYIASNDVPYNALHDEFYPSIGCEPCTRAIAVGEDFRAGRWWWEDEAAKECGSGSTSAIGRYSRS